MSEGWIGVDLDGTLAEYRGWQGMGHIGEPIAPMVERVKAWLAAGKDVRIFTARVCSGQSQEGLDVFLREYTRWCFRIFGRQLPVTCEKDWEMIKLWDDRCVSVIPNTGEIIPLDSNERVKELEAERDRLRDALNLIGTKADFCADECEYGPDATSFRLIADDAKRVLKGTEQEVE